MSTTLAKPAEMVDRKWYVIDAAGKPLGRVAAQAAVLLRGKNKTTFTPNVDCGDHVIVINCDEAVLTGKKLEKKYHRTHSGWIGGLKETQYKTLMAEASDKAMTYAVKGMVPSNTLGAKAMTRLHCYKMCIRDRHSCLPVCIIIRCRSSIPWPVTWLWLLTRKPPAAPSLPK